MVRPHSGSPRSRQRAFSDSSHSDRRGGHMGPPTKRFRGHPGKAPPSWREHSGGPSPYPKRPPMVGETRDRPHGHWTQPKKDNYRPYPVSQNSQRGRRRPSPRSNRPPPAQHRTSPHSPSHGPPGHHRPFHGNNSGRVSPSSRYFHSPPSDRRGPSPHSTFRPPQRYSSPVHEQERGWGPGRHANYRGRPTGRPPYEGQRWNGPGVYPKSNGGPRPSGSPQRKPREFQERSSYPERWSAERDPRRQHGVAGRDRGRARPGYHAPEWARHEGSNPYPRPPFRSPSWKAGPPSSRFPPPMRPAMRPFKRRSEEMGRPLASIGEHGPPKRFRREMPIRFPPTKFFGGRGLSLKDKSRLLTRRKFREESVARFKTPLSRISDKMPGTSKNVGEPSRVAPRKVLLKKSVKRRTPRQPEPDSKSADPERDSEAQVESRRSVRARSSSPLDRQLTRDLVVVSHWEAGNTRSSSPKSSTSWKTRTSNKTDGSLSERFGNIARDQKRHGPMTGQGKPFRKPGPFQRPGFRPTRSNPVLKKGPDGVFRRPLMATIIPRPPAQKPMLRKSQSIMTKYRNLQVLRHKAPAHPRQATSYRRW